jgi:ribonuclease D
MRLVSNQAELDAICADFAEAPYVTVDTEFLRERTYWPQLCLLQMARPIGGDPSSEEGAVLIDPLAAGLDLGPVHALMANPSVVKVFHAARQDVEIFYHFGDVIPTPLFDTQVAAMVCGYGDQVGYETLVRKIAKAQLDKSSRFTDWSRRPLSDKQLHYALGDVTYLRSIYEHLSKRLEETGREHWVAEEIGILTDPATYNVHPEDAWRRLKTRTNSAAFLAIARELAAWRESAAQERDVPRGRVIKDEALLEIAANRPKTEEELGRSRLLQREARKPKAMEEILSAVARGEACPPEDRPDVPDKKPQKTNAQALSDLLKVLLKARSEETGVAPKLIASSADLEAIAAGDMDGVAALHGWRREVFGEDALRLKRGEIALSAKGSRVRITKL